MSQRSCSIIIKGFSYQIHDSYEPELFIKYFVFIPGSIWCLFPSLDLMRAQAAEGLEVIPTFGYLAL